MNHLPFKVLIAAFFVAMTPLEHLRADELTHPPELVTSTRIGLGLGELKIVESHLDLQGSGASGSEPQIRATARSQPMGWRLFIGLKPVLPAPDDSPDAGYFLLRFPLFSARAGLPFYLIGPEGEISHGIIHVNLAEAEWDRLRAVELAGNQTHTVRANQPKSSYFHAGLALPYLSFRQSGLADYSQLALTAQVSARLAFARNRARASLNGAITLMPILKSGGISARTLDIDGQIRYGWPVGPSGRWTLFVNGGLYYRTMIVTDDYLGFHHVSGPLLYPSIRRSWTNGGSAGAYLKLSPITDGISFLGLTSHELSLGVDWAIVLPNRHILTVSTDLSAFRMVFSDVEMSSLTLAMGVKYGF